MADPRPQHRTLGPSLLNQPNPVFPGAGNALYGSRGPARSELDYRRSAGHKAPDGHEPQSLADHIDGALRHVAGLTPRQRQAACNELVKLCRDISFIRMVTTQTGGPHSDQAAGIPADEGRPL
jgi:hypothetical protein